MSKQTKFDDITKNIPKKHVNEDNLKFTLHF